MFGFLCKVIGHKFQYLNRYYRCTRCGVRRCDLDKVVGKALEDLLDAPCSKDL